MCKPFRDPQLSFVLCTEVDAYPLPKGRRAFSDIHRDIKHFTNDTTHQFPLCMRSQLIMEPT